MNYFIIRCSEGTVLLVYVSKLLATVTRMYSSFSISRFLLQSENG